MRILIAVSALLLASFVIAQDSMRSGLDTCVQLLPAGYEFRVNAEIVVDKRSGEATLRDGRFGVSTRLDEGQPESEEGFSVDPFVECLGVLIAEQSATTD